MIADGLTNPLLLMEFHAFVKQLGMAPPISSTSAAPLLPTSLVQIEEVDEDDNAMN